MKFLEFRLLLASLFEFIKLGFFEPCFIIKIVLIRVLLYFQVAQLLQYTRIELVKLLEQKMQDPLLNLLNHQHGKRIIRSIVKIISSH